MTYGDQIKASGLVLLSERILEFWEISKFWIILHKIMDGKKCCSSGREVDPDSGLG